MSKFIQSLFFFYPYSFLSPPRRVILPYLPFLRGVQYRLVGNLLYQVTIFSHLMVLSPHCAVPTLHVTVLLSHLTVPLLYFLSFDGSIFTFCSFNIICDSFFVTFGCSLTFSSHLTVISSLCAIPTSHVTILLSHSMVPLLFSHI